MAEKAVQEIVKGIIYAEFDDRRGPVALARLPITLDHNTVDYVATITIDIFTNERFVQDKILLIPFPVINKKGLVRIVIGKDEKRRGGQILGTLTVLFAEENDSIFYKYQNDFKDTCQIFVHKIIRLRENKDPDKALQSILEDFQASLITLLNQLAARENPLHAGLEEFPSTTEGEEEKANYKGKVIVIGNPGVGKTSTILRYTAKAFNRSYIPTLGFNITKKFLQIQDAKFLLTLWDLAGQTKYERMRAQIYQGAVGAILVYDVTNRRSFEDVPKWHKDVTEILAHSHPLEIFLCGNKCDSLKDRVITPEEGKALAQRLGVMYLETSALTGENITETFERMVSNLLGYYLRSIKERTKLHA